jgi:hypothetical protein
LLVVFLTLFAVSLVRADEPPELPPIPDLSPEVLEQLDPYFRNALWYYENYSIEKDLNESLQRIIDERETLQEQTQAQVTLYKSVAIVLAISTGTLLAINLVEELIDVFKKINDE